MPRRSLQERIEQMRKKIEERTGNVVVVKDREAFEALSGSGLPSKTIRVITSHCCGVEILNNTLVLN